MPNLLSDNIEREQRILGNVKHKGGYWFAPSNRLPYNSEVTFNTYKRFRIYKILINRAPIVSMVDKALNWLSLGSFGSAKKDLGYDSFFHLSMLLYTEVGPIKVEKNDRINISTDGVGGGESVDVDPKRYVTIDTFINKGRQYLGDKKFFQYDAFNRGEATNCQGFLLGLLRANNMLTLELEKFISQDTETLLKKLPGYISPVANFFTDLAGRANQIIYGQGISILERSTKLKPKKSSGNEYKKAPSFKITRSKNKNKKYTVVYNGKKINISKQLN